MLCLQQLFQIYNMKYIPIILVALLFGCSTINKHKSVEKVFTDSLSVIHVDSIAVKTVDSAKVIKDNTITITDKTDDYKEVTVFEFGTSRSMPNPQDSVMSGASKEDYFPVIKKITVTKTGTKKENIKVAANTIDSSWFRHKDSVVLNKDTKTGLKKTEIKKDIVVKRTSYWGWLWIGLGIAAVYLVGWYFGIWGWLILFIKKTRKK